MLVFRYLVLVCLILFIVSYVCFVFCLCCYVVTLVFELWLFVCLGGFACDVLCSCVIVLFGLSEFDFLLWCLRVVLMLL